MVIRSENTQQQFAEETQFSQNQKLKTNGYQTCQNYDSLNSRKLNEQKNLLKKP